MWEKYCSLQTCFSWNLVFQQLILDVYFIMKQNRVGLVEVLLGILDWRAGGRQGLCNQMKWNESEASIGRVLAVEVTVGLFLSVIKSSGYLRLVSLIGPLALIMPTDSTRVARNQVI